ncbi:hypothetical protein HT746_07625 [Burkholderia pyrrocinia]|uniref:hypothetical protein n=1 Tax=Burkholderia pyrrocinia TaxID=60550 RepID=UPI0015775F71|nr:hypothetical protein [Burkholderia pyrrocinia]NTX27003.1 hypothetical protein [Burkholderia pyrrocinia]
MSIDNACFKEPGTSAIDSPLDGAAAGTVAELKECRGGAQCLLPAYDDAVVTQDEKRT